MGRPATGSIVEDECGGATAYALRFRADRRRQYVALDSASLESTSGAGSGRRHSPRLTWART